MDKNSYYKDHQELTMEISFTGDASIKDILKAYILETGRSRMAMRSMEDHNQEKMDAVPLKGDRQ